MVKVLAMMSRLNSTLVLVHSIQLVKMSDKYHHLRHYFYAHGELQLKLLSCFLALQVVGSLFSHQYNCENAFLKLDLLVLAA